MLSTSSNQEGAAQRHTPWVAAIMGLVALVAVVLAQPSARALEETPAEQQFTRDFSSLRDPRDFSGEIQVVLPRSLVPMNRQDAISRQLLVRSKTLSRSGAERVSAAIVEEADRLGYDPLIFLALIRIESNYDHLAVSPVGAEGLMQLMPPTARWMADRTDEEWPEGHSFDPVLNVRLGVRYLVYLIHQFNGRVDHALTAYNRGPSNTKYILRHHGGRLPPDIQEFYSGKVMTKYRELRALYGHLPAS